MSLNVNPLIVKRVIDPRLDIAEGQKSYKAVGGAMINSWTNFPASNVSNTNVVINCNPPSQDTCISRLVYKTFTFEFTITGTNTSGGVLLNEGYIAPRAMPLTCVTEAESVSLGGDTITQAPVQQYWRAMLRYRNDVKNRNGVFSLSPAMLDQHQNYEDGVNGNRNPLAGYDDNSSEQTRGSYVGFTLDPQTPGNTTATGRLTTTEPILIAPFAFGENSNNYASFIGLMNMKYNTTLGNLSRILSVVQGQGAPVGQIVLNNPVVNLTNASILFNYFTPDPSISPIPALSEYSYYNCVPIPTRSNVAVAPGATVNLVMGNYQVNSIPKRIYVYARRDDADETAFTADSYLSLPRNQIPLNLTWDNRTYLSTATTEDLYNISVKNGCDLSYTQYTSKVGSVLALDFGIDVGLQPQQAPGSLGNYQLKVQCNFTNTSSQTITPTLYVVVVSEGVFNITNGNASHMIGVLSPEDVLGASEQERGDFERYRDVYGGSWQDFRDFVSKGLSYAKEHKLISRGLAATGNPYGLMASKVADALGYGVSGGGLSGGHIDFKQQKKNKKYLSEYC